MVELEWDVVLKRFTVEFSKNLLVSEPSYVQYGALRFSGKSFVGSKDLIVTWKQNKIEFMIITVIKFMNFYDLSTRDLHGRLYERWTASILQSGRAPRVVCQPLMNDKVMS